MTPKYKQQLAISAVLVVVVLAGLYFFVFRKPKPEQTGPAARPTGTTAAAPGTKAVAGKAPAAMSKAEALKALLSLPPGSLPPGLLPGAPAGAVEKPTEPYRPDPFANIFPPPPPPRQPPPPPPLPAAIQVGIPPVFAQLLPSEGVREIAEREQGRMAGVLWNDRVYAIIETDTAIAVVQPGDTVDGRTVRSISPQEAILASKSGEEVKVPLRGAMGMAPRVAPAATPPGSPALPVPDEAGGSGEY